MSRSRVYAITFITYMGIHAMRMSYSFAKPQISLELDLSESFMGLLDFLTHFSIGLGFAMKYVIRSYIKDKPTKFYLTFISISSLAYAFFPFLSLIFKFSEVVEKVLLGSGLVFFGFFQFAAWPVVLLLISQYFDFK